MKKKIAMVLSAATLGAATLLPVLRADADDAATATLRLPITVSAGEHDRTDAITETRVDFGTLFDQAGSPGQLDEASLVVHEVDASGAIVAGPYPVQFDEDAPGASTGTLLFEIPGAMAAGSTRRVVVSFGHHAGFSPQVGPAGAVTVTDTTDEGQQAFKISTPRADWYLQKQGASFSSVVDANGVDWVGYHPGNGFDGQYRGIGQLTDDYFHPGGTHTSGVTQDIASSGQLKAVFTATSTSPSTPGWTQRFEVYPTFVRSTVTPPSGAAAAPWWFLYEGSPNGDDYVKNGGTGTVTRSDGQSFDLRASWDADLAQNPSWVNYAVGNRSFFMSHASADGAESSQIMGNSMVVFGFGRTLGGGGGPLTGGPQTFTYGILETGDGTTAGAQIAAINSQPGTGIDPGGVTTSTTSSTASTASTTSTTSTTTGGGGSTPSAGSGYVPVAPVRLLDTRNGSGSATVPAGTVRTLRVRGAETGVAATADAVLLNVTATNPTRAAYVRVWPSGGAQPATSSLNLGAGDTVPNLVTTGIGAGDSIDIVVSDGAADIVVDLVGYYDSATASGGYHGVNPIRALDTRDGNGTPVGPQGTIDVDVAAALGVAPSQLAGVALNATVTAPSAGGYLAVYPAGGEVPYVSSLNFSAGQTVANAVVVGTSADGRISAFNAAGTVHVVIDVVGWYEKGTAGARFHAVNPVRAFDSRQGTGPIRVGQSVSHAAVGSALGVDAAATAVVSNITVTDATGASFITAWPSGEPAPWASMQNTVAGTTRANQAMVKVGAGGQISLQAGGQDRAVSVQLITDIVGYFS